MALRVRNIDGYVLVQQQDNLVDIAIESGAVEEVEALVVGEKGISAVVEQQIDDVVVAALCSPEYGCCNSVPPFGVDGCAGLDQKVAECVVVVDGSPLLLSSASSPSTLL